MIRKITNKERGSFDSLATHPLQSFSWGEFRQKTGVMVSRLGRYTKNKLVETAQVTWHKIPGVPVTIGYWPRGVLPTKEMVLAVKKEAEANRAIMIKLEPNVKSNDSSRRYLKQLSKSFFLIKGRSLFTKWSFTWDLDKPEVDLMAAMKQKTRYNTRLAAKKGVKIVEDNSDLAFEEYWQLTEETTKRQGFYAHTKKYHRLMFEAMVGGGIAHLFKAVYQGKTLAVWIVFLLNGVLYYPYGASSRENNEVFASNLMMWEVAKWGKQHGAKTFDLWGSPGPNPKPNDKWIGFHKFKEGYGATMTEFVGTYDLITNPILYFLYRIGEVVRWTALRMKRG